ncbi:hypothetical protein MAR_031016, partial [Mya arenaria]
MVSESEHAPIADPLLCRTMGGESVAGCPQRMEGGTGDDQCPQRMEGGTGDDQCPQRMEGGTGDDQCPQRMEGGTHVYKYVFVFTLEKLSRYSNWCVDHHHEFLLPCAVGIDHHQFLLPCAVGIDHHQFLLPCAVGIDHHQFLLPCAVGTQLHFPHPLFCTSTVVFGSIRETNPVSEALGGAFIVTVEALNTHALIKLTLNHDYIPHGLYAMVKSAKAKVNKAYKSMSIPNDTIRNCSRNHDLYSTFIKSDAYIDGSNPPVRRLSSSSQPLQKSKISSSKNSSGSCNSVIRGCDTNACDIPSVHTKGVFKAVDPNCTHICVAQRDFNFIGDCPLTHCDYECAAQRFANRTPGTRGRNGQRKKTLIEEMELSDFSMMDETSDATPERDRRKRNQQEDLARELLEEIKLEP